MFPEPWRLVELKPDNFGMPVKRAMTIKELAFGVSSGELDFGLTDDPKFWSSSIPFQALISGQPNAALFVLGVVLMLFRREIL